MCSKRKIKKADMKKRRKLISIGLAFFCLCAVVLHWRGGSAPMQRAAFILQSDMPAFSELALEILDKGNSSGCSHPDVRQITYFPECGYIEFLCGASGFVPSSSYYGFYYSADAVPKGFQGVSIPLSADGIGWRWEDPHSSKCYYTEPVNAYWYLYEMHF